MTSNQPPAAPTEATQILASGQPEVAPSTKLLSPSAQGSSVLKYSEESKVSSADLEPAASKTLCHQSTLKAVEAPRPVIAVSTSKGPTAFFNLARKFLVVDEMCDFSALEGAIVFAVDAAHLLERAQLATIVR